MKRTTTKDRPLMVSDEQGEDEEEDLALPVLPQVSTGAYPNPNEVLPLDVEGKLTLTANDFVSKRTIILGESGAGKGNTGALITEHLLEHGLPMTILDLEGESWSLKEICSTLLVVGRSAHADREYAPEQMGRLAELSVEQGFSVVLDFSGYEEEEYYALLVPYLKSLWAVCDRKRTPYHLVVDEVHEFVPQVGTTPVKQRLIRLAKRGRKRGLGMIAMSQETASVDNQLLKQIGMTILLSVHYPADLDRYQTLIPGMTRAAIEQTVPKFSQGKGFVIYKHTPLLVQFLQRRTYDPSETPLLGAEMREPLLHTLDETTLHVLDEHLPSSVPLTPEYMDRAALITLVKTLQQADVGAEGVSPSFMALQVVLDQKEQEVIVLRSREAQEREELARLRTERAEQQTRIEQLERQRHEDTLLLSYGQAGDARALELPGRFDEQEQEKAFTIGLASGARQDTDTPHLLLLETLVTQVDQLEGERERLQAEVAHLRAARDGRDVYDTGITNVHFEQASIDTFYAGAGVSLPGKAVKTGDPENALVTVVSQEPMQQAVLTGADSFSLERLPYSERKSFSRLCSQVEGLSPSENVLFLWLVEHDGEEFFSQQLTDAVNMDIHAAWSQRTEKLARISFVQRWKSQNKLWYKADFASYSRKNYASVLPSVLKQELLRIASF